MVSTVNSSQVCELSEKERKGLRTGDKVLLIFSEPLNEFSTPVSERSPCIIAPNNSQNLAEVQRGIDRANVFKDE